VVAAAESFLLPGLETCAIEIRYSDFPPHSSSVLGSVSRTKVVPKHTFRSNLLRSGREGAGRVEGIEDDQVSQVVLLAAERAVVKGPSEQEASGCRLLHNMNLRVQLALQFAFNNSLVLTVCLLREPRPLGHRRFVSLDQESRQQWLFN